MGEWNASLFFYIQKGKDSFIRPVWNCFSFPEGENNRQQKGLYSGEKRDDSRLNTYTPTIHR